MSAQRKQTKPAAAPDTNPVYVSRSDQFRKSVRNTLAQAQADEAKLEADIAELQASLQVANAKLADVREVMVMAEAIMGDTPRQIEGHRN